VININRLAQCTSDSCTRDDEDRNTPLILAAKNGHVEAVRALLQSGADVQRSSAKTETALHWAAWNGHPEVCSLLLDWGAKVNTMGGGGTWKATALHWAAYADQLSVVKLLVGRGADVSLTDANGETAAVWARNKGRINVADWLDSKSRG
jgi:ankyrin repeat protein